MTIKGQRTVVEQLRARYGAELLPYGHRGDGRLEDDGRSARMLEGRDFAQLVDDIEAGRVKPDYLIVAETSSLAREDTFSEDKRIQVQSAIDNARVNSILRVNGVKVIDRKGIHEDIRQESLKNSQERDDIRARTVRGKRERLGEGKRATGGYAAYGYMLVRADPNRRGSGLVQVRHPENAEYLHLLIAWFIEGGYAHAAREATKAGFPLPKTKRIAPWNAVTVRHIIKNVLAGVYSGKQTIEYLGESHTITYERLVDAKTEAAVLRASKELTVTPRTNALLSTGNVDCRCGAHVHQRRRHDKHHATCAQKCGSVPEPVFNATLWLATVARLLQIKEHDGGDIESNNFDVRLRAAHAKVTDIEDKIGRL